MGNVAVAMEIPVKRKSPLNVMAVEIESKIQVPGPDARLELPEALESLGLIVVASGHRTVKDVYMDTESKAVKGAGWALRFRQASDSVDLVRTQKALTPITDGLAHREELEAVVSEMDASWEGQPLVESFKVFQDRWWFHVEPANGAFRIEASYDFVQWRKAGTVPRPPAHVVELELLEGSVEALGALMERLLQIPEWKAADWSKFLG